MESEKKNYEAPVVKAVYLGINESVLGTCNTSTDTLVLLDCKTIPTCYSN